MSILEFNIFLYLFLWTDVSDAAEMTYGIAFMNNITELLVAWDTLQPLTCGNALRRCLSLLLDGGEFAVLSSPCAAPDGAASRQDWLGRDFGSPRDS